MAQGIMAVHRLEAEFFQRRSFPEVGVAQSLEEWTQALLLPQGWEVVGVAIVPVTDLFVFLLESDQINESPSGLNYVTPFYLASDDNRQVALKRLVQSVGGSITDGESGVCIDPKEEVME